ncbi:hypothetical protein CBS101457_003953 [Exobasidium rhododendri]|nr:hypothetical protein CBS101457_003953 [Exobasidium rhododendri]
MGRNKNKDNRSAARRINGVTASGSNNKKRDTGLPNFFKQRKSNSAPTKVDAQSYDEGDMSVDGAEGADKASQYELVEEIVQKDSFLLDKAAKDLTLSGKRDSSTRAFMKDVKNVIDSSDVILQVLDARDPLGSRSRQTEVMAMSSGKKVVLIMNKVDLIPTSNLQGWLKYLRNDFPTLAFKASTQQQRGNLKQGNASLSLHDNEKKKSMAEGGSLTFGSEAVGAASLLQLLKNYARTTAKGSNLKHQLTVGVIGPPNVGKSSLINSLLRTRACAVASTPGWTKAIQGVMLEKGIRLLDCPGVVVTGGAFTAQGAHDAEQIKLDNAWSVLRNTIKVELIEDPIVPVQALMSRVEPDQLSKLYNIEGGFNEGDAHDFLLRVALMRGKLGKGGIADLDGAAKIVLHDWNIGRISFHTRVPVVHHSALAGASSREKSGAEDNTAGVSLMTGLDQAFDLEALLGEADAEALGGGGGEKRGNDLIVARERRELPTRGDREEVEEEEEATPIVEDDDENVVVRDGQNNSGEESFLTSSTLGKRRRGLDAFESGSDSEEEMEEETKVPLSPVSSHDLDREGGSEAVTSEDLSGFLESSYQDRKQRKAEMPTSRQRDLLTIFSKEEIRGIGQRRSEVRKAAKKKKKRLLKSEAGLVDIWNKGLELPQDGNAAQPAGSKGLFHVPDLPSPLAASSKQEEHQNIQYEEEL